MEEVIIKNIPPPPKNAMQDVDMGIFLMLCFVLKMYVLFSLNLT